jgi:hypothetical protein
MVPHDGRPIRVLRAPRAGASRRRLGRRLAPQVGFEPTTLRLTAGCSTLELLRTSRRGGSRDKP